KWICVCGEARWKRSIAYEAADELFLSQVTSTIHAANFVVSLHTSACSFCDLIVTSCLSSRANSSDWSKSRSFGEHLKARFDFAGHGACSIARQISALRVQRTSHSSLTYHTKIQSEYTPVFLVLHPSSSVSSTPEE